MCLRQRHQRIKTGQFGPRSGNGHHAGRAAPIKDVHVGGRRYALLVVLAHSRLLWLRFYRQQTMAVLIEGLESAFARFGWVPAELLFDQMGAVVLSDDRSSSSELVMNAEFLRFRGALGLHAARMPTVSSRTKGQGGATDPLSA